uniref:Uncharacterized protein n=1 Tax=Heterorhabditis bacteriophora TaxID=37862 RepID=A0A1I7WUD0_HETBA
MGSQDRKDIESVAVESSQLKRQADLTYMHEALMDCGGEKEYKLIQTPNIAF